MKPAFTILLGLLLMGCSREPVTEVVRVVRDGRESRARSDPALTGKVINLLESCSAHTSEHAVQTNTWDELLRSDSFVRVTFVAPRELTVMMQTDAPSDQEKRWIDEILVPLPRGEGGWPPHVFARSGTNVWAFAKYRPSALKELAFDRALGLSRVKPYSSLADLEK